MNANALSRLPLADSTPEGNLHDVAIFNFKQLEHLPVSVKEIASTETIKFSESC